MPNGCELRNSSQSCHWPTAGAANSRPASSGDADAQQPQAVPEELVEALDEGMGVGRERRRRQAVGDDQVEDGQRREGAAEQHEHQQLGPQHRPEHARPADRVEPQVVDVEAGEEPAEQQEADDEDGDRRSGDAPLVGEPTATSSARHHEAADRTGSAPWRD